VKKILIHISGVGNDLDFGGIVMFGIAAAVAAFISYYSSYVAAELYLSYFSWGLSIFRGVSAL